MSESDNKEALSDTELRRYFRVQNTLTIAFRKITPQALEQQTTPAQTGGDVYALSTRLEQLNQESRILLRRLAKNDPILGEYLVLMEQKNREIADFLLGREVEWDNQTTQEVNLSASGISFHSEWAMESGDILEMKLILLPERTGLRVYGRVINCQSSSVPPQPGYQIAVDFMGLEDSERDILIAYLIKRQQEQLRHGK